MRLRWLLALLALAQLMDWALTETFIRLGVPEGNPFLRPLVWPAAGLGVLAVKGLYTLAIAGAMTLTVRIIPRLTRWTLAALTGAAWGVVGYSALAIIVVSLLR